MKMSKTKTKIDHLAGLTFPKTLPSLPLSYSKLCKVLNLTTLSTTGKRAQLTKLDSLCELVEVVVEDKPCYLIKKVYSEPLKKDKTVNLATTTSYAARCIMDKLATQVEGKEENEEISYTFSTWGLMSLCDLITEEYIGRDKELKDARNTNKAIKAAGGTEFIRVFEDMGNKQAELMLETVQARGRAVIRGALDTIKRRDLLTFSESIRLEHRSGVTNGASMYKVIADPVEVNRFKEVVKQTNLLPEFCDRESKKPFDMFAMYRKDVLAKFRQMVASTYNPKYATYNPTFTFTTTKKKLEFDRYYLDRIEFGKLAQMVKIEHKDSVLSSMEGTKAKQLARLSEEAALIHGEYLEEQIASFGSLVNLLGKEFVNAKHCYLVTLDISNTVSPKLDNIYNIVPEPLTTVIFPRKRNS
jgi:hypothetical protein